MLDVVAFAWVRNVAAWFSSSRTSSSLPPSAVLSSSVIVCSWSSPPPLMRSDAWASASSTVGAVSVSSSSRVVPSASSVALGGVGHVDEELTERRGVAEPRGGTLVQLGVGADVHGDDRGVVVDLDRRHLAAVDAVDLDRCALGEVEGLVELRLDLDGVAGDARAGDRQVPHGGRAARGRRQHSDRSRGRRDAPDGVLLHQLPPNGSVLINSQIAGGSRSQMSWRIPPSGVSTSGSKTTGIRSPLLGPVEVLQGERQHPEDLGEGPLLLEDGLHHPGRPVERLDDLGPVVHGELGDDGHRVVERARAPSGSSRARRPTGRPPWRPAG